MTATAPVLFKRPRLAAYQLDGIWCRERYGVIEASTKSGKTAGCLAWLAEQALKAKPQGNVWWIAPTFTVAKMAFRRQKLSLPRESYDANETELTIAYRHNGVRQWFKSADKPDTLFGEDVYAAVIDEASRCKEDAWHAIRSTLTATRGAIRIIGNVKGRKNWAYTLARKAEAGEPDMHYAKITAHDAVSAGLLAAEEVEDAQRLLPDRVFRELYLAEPSDDGGNPFGLEAIRRKVSPLTGQAWAVWARTQKPVVWGWDLAKSVDWTVGVALTAKGEVCCVERFQNPWPLTRQKIAALAGQVRCVVDSTGVGDPVLAELQRDGVKATGYKFTAPSKQQLMEGLAVAIQQPDSGLSYPEGVLVNELTAFEFVYTASGVHYSAPEGLHDDCVCALALAWSGFRRPPAQGTPLTSRSYQTLR